MKSSILSNKGGHTTNKGVYPPGIRPSSRPVVLHDDRLVLRAQKCDARLKPNWRKSLVKSSKITHYWNPSTGEVLQPKAGKSSPPGFCECRPRSVMLDKDVMLRAEGSYLDVRLNNLWSDLRARYRLCLNALEKAGDVGVLSYKPIPPSGTKSLAIADHLPEPSPSKMTKAHRLERRQRFIFMLEKVWKVAAYEHNLILLDYNIGQILLEELKPYDQAINLYPGTAYIAGFKKTIGDAPLKILAYDCVELHGQKAVKIEIVFRKEYLKRHDLRTAKQFLQQPDIQELLETALRREWK